MISAAACALLGAISSASPLWAQVPAATPPAPAVSGAPAAAQPPVVLVPFEAVNPREPQGDRLGPARKIAAAIIAQDNPTPKLVVDVGSFTGEFLEAFMAQFPAAHGQWTEPVTNNEANARRRFAPYGDRVDFVIGCANRDISLGCVPKGVDVMLTSWLQIHQDLPGIRKFYKEAAAMLPSGGWIVNLDHVRAPDPVWDQRMKGARAVATQKGLSSLTEGPPIHHKEFVMPTLADQIAALKAAGIVDVQVAWQRFDTVLIMGRKK